MTIVNGWRVFVASLLVASTTGCGDPGEAQEGVGPPGSDSGGAPEIETGATSQAVWLGTPSAGNLSIVELWRYGKSYPNCTGFFVGRSHILTASHCTSQYYSAEWYQVRIKTGYGTFTNLRDSGRSDNWVRLTVHQYPNYATDRGSDLALLYIEPQNQASVPPNQALMRVSTATPTIGEALGIWGWGIRSAGTTPARDLLTPANNQRVTVSGTSARAFWGVVNNGARTCQGDSGGPATRYNGFFHVAMGAHLGPTYAAGDQPWSCAEYGVQMDWAKLGDKASWIEATMRLELGLGFSCARLGSGSDAYMRCF